MLFSCLTRRLAVGAEGATRRRSRISVLLPNPRSAVGAEGVTRRRSRHSTLLPHPHAARRVEGVPWQAGPLPLVPPANSSSTGRLRSGCCPCSSSSSVYIPAPRPPPASSPLSPLPHPHPRERPGTFPGWSVRRTEGIRARPVLRGPFPPTATDLLVGTKGRSTTQLFTNPGHSTALMPELGGGT